MCACVAIVSPGEGTHGLTRRARQVVVVMKMFITIYLLVLVVMAGVVVFKVIVLVN